MAKKNRLNNDPLEFQPATVTLNGTEYIRGDLTNLEGIRAQVRSDLDTVWDMIPDPDPDPDPDSWYGVSIPALVNAARNAYQIIKDPDGTPERREIMLAGLRKVLAPLDLEDLK